MLLRIRTQSQHTFGGIRGRGNRTFTFSVQYPTNKSISFERSNNLFGDVTVEKESLTKRKNHSLFEPWSPEYEYKEQETEVAVSITSEDTNIVVESQDIFKEKETKSSGVHRVMGRKTHLVSCIENGQMDLAETLRDELIASGVHIKRNAIFTEAAIDAWRHKSADERTDAFYNWLRLIPHATRGQIRQTRLALKKVQSSIFSDPTDLNTIACFGLVCCRKGFASAFFRDVIAHIGRLASPVLSGVFLNQCQDQAKAFYGRFHKETHEDSNFSVWDVVGHNNHYVRILCIAGYSHEAFEWVKMLVEKNIKVESFTWTLLLRDFVRLELHGLVTMVKELRTLAITQKLTEDVEPAVDVDRPTLPTAQELAELLDDYVESADQESIEDLWTEIAVEGRSLDLWVVAIMKYYQNNGQPKLVLEQFFNYFMCIGVPKSRILHHITSLRETSSTLHPLLSVNIPPNFKPAAGGRFPSTHTLTMVWNALASLTADDTDLSSLYQTFLYNWDNHYPSPHSSKPLPVIDTDQLWKNISIQYPPVITPDTVMFHVFISRFAKSGSADTTLAILKDMHSRGIRPDTHNWTAVAGMFAKSRDMDRAMKILERMEKSNLNTNSGPSPASHTKNIDRVRNRRGFIRRSPTWMPSPNLVTYTNVWRGLIDSGDYQVAKEFSQRLESAGYVPGMNERTENVARVLQEREARHELHQKQRIGWKEELTKRDK